MWIWFLWNISFADKVDDVHMDDCAVIKSVTNWRITDETDIKTAYKNGKVLINYYQHHLSFIKRLDLQYPYLKKDILKYHKLFNEWLLELKEKWNISLKLIKKIKKKRKNLEFKIGQYE